MNKQSALALIFILLISSCSWAAQRQSRRAADVAVDDDEFSEFDDEFEKPPSTGGKTTPSPSSFSQQASSSSPRRAATTVADDDDDDFESVSIDDDIPASTPKRAAAAADDARKTARSTADEKKPTSGSQQTKSSDFSSLNADELDLEEFENFADDDEFESSSPPSSYSSHDHDGQDLKKAKQAGKDSKAMPNLKIADVPLHLMSTGNWTNYVWEICMLGVIAVYMVNFFVGKSKNYQLVNHWYQTHRALLEKSFAVVGDDGMSVDVPKSEENESGSLIKDSENSYALWCTGRHGCEGMLIQLKLIKRQDLINGMLMQLVKPQCDQIVISVEFAQQDDLDSFVFCLANRKCSAQVSSDYQDVSTYCVEKRLGTGASIVDAKYTELLATNVTTKYVMLNEIGEVPNNVLDKTVCAFLNKYPDMVEYLLISDQYAGFKAMGDESASSNQAASASASNTPTSGAAVDSQSVGIPKSRSILILCLNAGGRGLGGATLDDMEHMQPAIQLALYLADKAPHIRLSKEAKAKAQRKRKEVAEQYMKITHKQRQEAAMQRKEEKRRAEKEKIMNESDPEKQKKLEEKELKREKKKNLAKMKQIKIKAM